MSVGGPNSGGNSTQSYSASAHVNSADAKAEASAKPASGRFGSFKVSAFSPKKLFLNIKRFASHGLSNLKKSLFERSASKSKGNLINQLPHAKRAKDVIPEHIGNVETVKADDFTLRKNQSGKDNLLGSGQFGDVAEVFKPAGPDELINNAGPQTLQRQVVVKANNLINGYESSDVDDVIEDSISMTSDYELSDIEDGFEDSISSYELNDIDEGFDEESLSSQSSQYTESLISIGEDEESSLIDDVRKEVNIQSRVPGAPKVIDALVSADSDEFTIIMENGGKPLEALLSAPASSGSDSIKTTSTPTEASSYRKRVLGKGLREFEVRDLGRQLMKQVNVMHKEGIFHGDLKLDNTLVDNRGKASLIDYGVSEALPDGVNPETALFHNTSGSAAYMAPELLHNRECGLKANIWTMGKMLMEMADGSNLFFVQRESANSDFTFSDQALIEYQKTVRESDQYSDDFKDLVLQMTHLNPAKRPSAHEVLNHPFFQLPSPESMSLLELHTAHRETFEKLANAEDQLENVTNDEDMKAAKQATVILGNELKLYQSLIQFKEAETVLTKETAHSQELETKLNQKIKEFLNQAPAKRIKGKLKAIQNDRANKKEIKAHQNALVDQQEKVRSTKKEIDQIKAEIDNLKNQMK